jgi:beta-glucosidase
MKVRSRLVAAAAAGLVGITAGVTTAATATAADTPVYLDRSYSFSERAADLVSHMTLAEKASQVISSSPPGIPRLGVKPYGWWNEALHGVARLQVNSSGNPTILTNTTSYPISQSLGASWDPDLVYRVATQIGDEAREVVPNNTQLLDFYSPTMNLERDPRWGRTDETFSEDPHLTSELVSQFVDGMEGKDEDGRLLPESGGYHKTITTVKHYAANNSEVNRLTGSSDMDDRTLREYYTKAFRDVIRKADPGSIMSAYNSVNGTPVSVDPYLLDTLLRQTFGFNGYVTSDCDAIFEVTNGHHWQPPTLTRPVNTVERHAFAMAAGTDLNCNAGFHDAFGYANTLPTAVDQGISTLTDTFNVNDLDTSLTRLFTARMELGEFDDDTDVPWVREARARVPKDSWASSEANGAVTETPARLGLAREAADKSIVLLENDATTRKDGTAGRLLPLSIPTTGRPKIAVIGQLANPAPVDTYLGGYSSIQGAAGQANIVNGLQGIRSAVQAINPRATVDFLRGFTGTGTRAEDLTAVDPAAVAAAKGYDAVIVYAGTDAASADEGTDRRSIQLPGAQASLIGQVADQNPNTVVYMETIGPVDVSAFSSKVAAILWSSYNGQRKGEALADVLTGKVDPSGRVPSIWYQNDAQLPDITDYAIRPSGAFPGRTAQYFSGPLAYAFGHGLSYTTFEYSDLAVEDDPVDANGTIDVRVRVRNSGDVAGTDTVQLYATTPDAPASAQRPIKRLVAFQKVALGAGEAKTVRMAVRAADLAFYDQDQKRWVFDPSRYSLQVARSSAAADVALTADVHVTGSLGSQPSVVTAKPVMAGDRARDIATRVSFPEGVDIDPQLTVAMADDTLYGYVQKGSSRPFPAGMTFSYSSNRPEVVAVQGEALRTVGNGVATVTAKVTYQGATRETSFVVRVASKLASLTVGGKPVSAYDPGRGFAPDVYDYDVVVPDDVTGVPQVAATAGAPDTQVRIEQATGVPGTARVIATGVDGIQQAYSVHLAHRAVGDEFNGTLGPQWSFVRRDAAHTGLTAQALTITPQAGDLNGATNTATNVLVQPALGDWTIASKLDLSAALSANGQQAGIIAYQGDDDFLRLGVEYASGAPRLALTAEDSASGAPVTQPLASIATATLLGDQRTVWLKLVKRGPRYTAYWSKDGSDYRVLYETGASLTNARVGLYAFGPAGADPGLRVAFDWVRIANGATAPAGEPATPPAAASLPPSLGPAAANGGLPDGASPSGAPAGPSPADGGGGGAVTNRAASNSPSSRALVLASRTIRVDGRRHAAVALRCPALRGQRCHGTLTVRGAGGTVARNTVTLNGGRATTARVTVSRATFRTLQSRRRIAVSVGLGGATTRATLVAPLGQARSAGSV